MQKTLFVGTIRSLGLDHKALECDKYNCILAKFSFIIGFLGGKERYTLQHPNVKLAQEG